MDFDPTLLRAFVAVNESGGFTRAARRLHLTQSAVSHQIRRLEEQLGRQLLHRTTRNLTLTEDGEEFLRHSMHVLAALDALTERFQRSAVTGSVRLGVPESLMGHRLPMLLREFARRFPSTRLNVSVASYLDLRQMIDSGELDLAIVASAPGSQEGTPLKQTQFVWVAAEGFETVEGAAVPLAFAPPPCINREIGVAALERASVKWHVVFTSTSLRALRTAVMAGLAVTVLTREELDKGLKVVSGQLGLPTLPKATFAVIWSPRGKTPAAAAFEQLLCAMS